MKQNNLFNLFAYLSTLSGIAFIFLILFWLIYPYKTITFNSVEFPINKTVVKQGGTISYSVDYCKYINSPATVTRSFINALIYVTPSTINERPMGCNVLNIQVVVPQELPPGNYYMQMNYQYQVNPIRKISILHNTEEFQVIN